MEQQTEALRVARVSKTFPATKQERSEWARRYLESGLSLREFSARNGMGYMSLWRWVNKANKVRDEAAPVRSPEGPTFTEIKLLPSVERSDWVAELSLADGKVLCLSKEVPASMLEQLLRLC